MRTQRKVGRGQTSKKKEGEEGISSPPSSKLLVCYAESQKKAIPRIKTNRLFAMWKLKRNKTPALLKKKRFFFAAIYSMSSVSLRRALFTLSTAMTSQRKHRKRGRGRKWHRKQGEMNGGLPPMRKTRRNLFATSPQCTYSRAVQSNSIYRNVANRKSRLNENFSRKPHRATWSIADWQKMDQLSRLVEFNCTTFPWCAFL